MGALEVHRIGISEAKGTLEIMQPNFSHRAHSIEYLVTRVIS